MALERSELVQNLQLGLYGLHILVIHLGLRLESRVRATSTVSAAIHVPHQHLVALHPLLKLLYFEIELGKLVLFFQSSFRFNPHQLIIIEDISPVIYLLSLGKLQVLIPELCKKLAFLPINVIVVGGFSIIGRIRVQCPRPLTRERLLLAA